MVVLCAPGLRAEYLARPELPTLRALAQGGAVGWMNCRTARVPGQRREPEEAAYLTLGAGSRAAAGSYARVLTSPILERLKAENARLDHPVAVGALGGMLRAAGIKTAVIGAEDDPNPRRAALLLAMDPAGRVDVDLTVREAWSRPDAREPSGFRTSLFVFARGGSAQFQVWVYGDLARADRSASRFPPETAARQRRAALERLDVLLASFIRELPPDTRVLLLAPAPADSAPPGDRLAPILMFGEGVEPGLLTSSSTQRAGLVANTDFLPTVAAWFDLKVPAGMVGRPMEVIAGLPSTPERWAAQHERWAVTAALQSAFGGLPTIQFLLVVAAMLGWVFRCSGVQVFRSPPRPLAFSPLLILALPLAQLLLPPVSPAAVWKAGLFLGAVLAAVGGIGAWRPGWAGHIGVLLMGLLAAAVLLDLATGGWLMQQAWMSYSVMEGARYYGIGNEFAGAFFAAAMIAAGSLTTHDSRLTTLILTACALFVGLPGWGANAGGFLGMAVGIGAAWLIWRRGKLRARDLLTVLALAALLMTALIAFDLAWGGAAQSHIARAITSGTGIADIVARKAALNGYLLLHSPWTPGLLASIAGLWMLWRAPDSRLKAVLAENRTARGAATGLLFGAAALFLFNDSGVVCASETLLLTWAAAFLQSCSTPPFPNRA
jgi:hypothetical protein